jgi:hypothetical protein
MIDANCCILCVESSYLWLVVGAMVFFLVALLFQALRVVRLLGFLVVWFLI